MQRSIAKGPLSQPELYVALPGTSAFIPNRPAGSRSTLPYIAGIDGLRAIAVISVLLYHAQDIDGIALGLKPQGGFLGVEVFFVISGFLITALLVEEHAKHERINLRDFWLRRARRLLPALYLFLAGTAAFAALFATDALDKIRQEVFGAVLYVSNWVSLANDESYFEAAGRPSLLRHLWSLAIEEQFYLVWPILVAAGLRWGGTRTLAALTAAAAAASTTLLWLLFDRVEQYGDVTSVYYRTDARAAALLIGSALAFVWQPWRTNSSAKRLGPTARSAIDLVGLIALITLIAMQYVFTDRVIEWASYTRLYHGGFLALSVTTLVVLAAVSVPGSRLGLALGNPVMRWIGARSYGLYLWHWPIFQLTRPRLDVDLNGYALLAVRLVITIVLVELSYRLLEIPVRRRSFVAQANALMSTPRGIGLVTAGGLCLVAAIASVAVALPTVDRSPTTEVRTLVAQSAPDQAATTEATVADLLPAPTPTMAPARPTPTPLVIPVAPLQLGDDETTTRSAAPADPEAMDAQMPTPTPTQPPLPPPPPLSAPFDIATSQIHIVGDSVVEGAHAQLLRISPRVTVDGRIGRQWWELEAELRLMRAQGLANDVVIIQLGNNGNFTTQMFDGVMSALQGTRLVLFINIHAPVLWEAEVNGMLTRNVNRYATQARLLDWYTVSAAHPEFFIEDGTHLQGSGMVAFRRLIEGALVDLG